ncbi:MAG: SDR family NAD(P)-dependent oxidoreductase, partial [Bacteroidota bacterium]
MNNLKDKVAVVTGGNSGIGFATASKFKEHGARVIISGRSKEKVDAAAQKLGVHGVVADVNDLGALDGLVAE